MESTPVLVLCPTRTLIFFDWCLLQYRFGVLCRQGFEYRVLSELSNWKRGGEEAGAFVTKVKTQNYLMIVHE